LWGVDVGCLFSFLLGLVLDVLVFFGVVFDRYGGVGWLWLGGCFLWFLVAFCVVFVWVCACVLVVLVGFVCVVLCFVCGFLLNVGIWVVRVDCFVVWMCLGWGVRVVVGFFFCFGVWVWCVLGGFGGGVGVLVVVFLRMCWFVFCCGVWVCGS